MNTTKINAVTNIKFATEKRVSEKTGDSKTIVRLTVTSETEGVHEIVLVANGDLA